jgi:transcriptional regulator with XRE-family HTH domain
MENNNSYENEFSLKKLRTMRDLEQKTLAEKIGLSQSGYAKKERKENDFTATELNKLAKYFNKTMDEMFKIINN